MGKKNKNNVPRESRLRMQAMGAKLEPRQVAGLITDTTNRVLGDELLLKDPFKSLATEYLGFLAARNEKAVEAAEVMADALPGDKVVEDLGKLAFQAGMDLVGKYQRPDTDAPNYPADLPVDMAEDIARQARAEVETHLAEVYNEQFGSIK